jgi:hypothetical protein
MKLKGFFIAGVVLIIVSISTFASQRYILRPQPTTCTYCQRPLRANLSVTAEINGKRAEVCCAHCAITDANQQHKPLKLVSVRDYPTGSKIAPASAWYVEGSRANACEHDAMQMNEMKGMQDLEFDRCSPGTFAFASKANAEAFVGQNGGSLLSFQELMREVHVQ